MIDNVTGRLLWNQLHMFAEQRSADVQRCFLPVWLERVKFNLGCHTCFKKVDRFISLWPPDFGKEFALWATCLHDYVNKELGKPLWAPHLTLEPLTRKGIIQ